MFCIISPILFVNLYIYLIIYLCEIRFPIFRLGCCGEDDWVADVAEIPVPTVLEKLFFEKRVGEYSNSGVGIDRADQSFALDASSFWDEWNDENVQFNIIS